MIFLSPSWCYAVYECVNIYIYEQMVIAEDLVLHELRVIKVGFQDKLR